MPHLLGRPVAASHVSAVLHSPCVVRLATVPINKIHRRSVTPGPASSGPQPREANPDNLACFERLGVGFEEGRRLGVHRGQPGASVEGRARVVRRHPGGLLRWNEVAAVLVAPPAGWTLL